MFAWLLRTLQRRRDLLPRMSETERQALAAGDVWIDAELFSGRPDFQRILREAYPELTAAERSFLAGPVERVCRAVDPASLDASGDLPPAVWALLQEHRFFGLALPRRYGGHELSALALSTVFGKLASRSLALSTVVLIPNSVGPGELILAVGTEAQRDELLPRLARGDEIPCFALTEPGAGSDAAALRSRGEVFRGQDGGLYVRLTWEKRYITLAPIATLLGLAFRLHDPDNLLGRGPDVGITCALVDTSLPGVEIGRRHDPMGIPFANGPTTGRDVVIPIERLLGGVSGAGRGWQMLMEALSGGRAVSLPAQAVAGSKHVARVAGAYAAVRRQFGLPIGRFEGVEEPLARLAGLVYLMEAARVFTCGAIDSGHRPAVVSAIVKYHQTELARRLAADAMDILGGAGLCRGPRNLVADAYVGSAIGITVEGANILTRTLILFGQGALRCHPHALPLLEAVRQDNARDVRRILGRWLLQVTGNGLRSVLLGLTRGRLARAPVDGPTAVYYRRLAWASARFAVYADLALFALGGRLKQRGKLTGRFADVLSWLYLATATLRRFEAEGRRGEDLPLVHWAVQHSLARIQEAFVGLCRNFDAPLIGWLLRGPVLLWLRLNPLGTEPSDRLGGQVARILQTPGDQRDRLTRDLFRPAEADHAMNVLERALELAAGSEPILEKIRRAVRDGRLPPAPPEELLAAAEEAGILRSEERELAEQARAMREEALRVDSFARVETTQGDPTCAAATP